MTHPVLHISRAQFVQNIAAVSARLAPSELMLVTKDDAYGHGLAWAAEEAARAGVVWFGSYDIAAGIRIRQLLSRPATVFAWATSEAEEVAEAILHDIDLGIGTLPYLQRVIGQAEKVARPARVHVKIDTGLHRNGIRPEDWEGFVAVARAAELAGTLQIVGLWSHLSEASDAEDDASQAVFHTAHSVLRASGSAPTALHLTASAASWARPELRGTLSRVGAFCYGIRSADGPELDGVRPIAALRAPVVSVSESQATIAIGSFDGLPSTLAGATVATPGGVRRLLSVDGMTSTVESWDGARTGDVVTLFGPGDNGEVSATSLAERIDTVGEEILTRLTPRVQRIIED